MLLSFSRRFLFVANTKTASTSIEAALRPFADIVQQEDSPRKHMPLAEVLETRAADFGRAGVAPDRVLSFGVMRDPVDWIGSWYRYRKGNAVESPLPPDMSFAAFWARADWNIRRLSGEKHLQRQIFCDGGIPIADIILPYDRLSDGVARICEGLSLPVADLPRENRSVLGEIDGMTPALEAEIRDYYAPDYRLYARLDAHNAPAWRRLAEGYYAAS